MEMNHANALKSTSTAALVKPKKETKSTKHAQERKDCDVGIVNGEGKPVCVLCKEILVTMKSLLYHMSHDHSDGDWKRFFRDEAKLGVMKFISGGWKLKANRGRLPLRISASDAVVPKHQLKSAMEDEGVQNMREVREELKVMNVAEDIKEAVESLMLLANDFDLNQAPSMEI